MSSTPGWYPDPAGTPGRFRYWDGQAWSHETTTDPTRARPASGGPGQSSPQAPPSDRRRGGRGLLIGIIAAAAALLVVLVLGVRALVGADDGPEAGPPPPSSTVSAWDETSRPDPTPSASPTPEESPPPAEVSCPTGDPSARNEHPEDDRVHGGGLSFPEVGGSWDSYPSAGMSWAYDVAGVADSVEPEWISLLAVGALRMADGFEEPRASAVMITQCLSTSDYYRSLSGAEELESAEITVDGQPGWRVRTEIRVDDPDVRAEGDVLDVIVVDTGGGESLGMFVGAVPIGDDARLAVLDETEANLAVD